MNVTTINSDYMNVFTTGMIMLTVFLILFCVLILNLCLNYMTKRNNNCPSIYGATNYGTNLV